MKPTALLAVPALFAASLLPLAALRSAPLTETTAVLSRPDAGAPVISYLKAGSEPAPAAEAAGGVPDGWMAVQLAGPFEGYVHNRDLTKGLDVKPGSALRLAPADGAGVIATLAKGDKTEITGIHGNWTRIRLDRGITGYIQVGPAAPAAAPLPVAAAAAPAGPGRAAPGFGPGDSDENLFPRFLEGRFVSTRNLLPFHKPYAWELVDESGNRRAYLDVSRLLETDQMDRYINRQVEVSGTMTALPNGRDVVVSVQSLSLK